MRTIKQTATYMMWERKLKDQRAKAAIAARIFRLANGLLGDVSPVGHGVSELRIHYGPGYRVYFQQRGENLFCCCVAATKAAKSVTSRRQKNSPASGGQNEKRSNLRL
jgi:putative addiction module killer protein